MKDSALKGQFGYTKREERLNFITHLASFLAAILGCVFMMKAAANADAPTFWGCAVFCLTLLGVFACSSLYHGLPDGDAKFSAKKLDHISVYFLIAGIYTAIALSSLQNWIGICIIIIIWVMAFYGTWKKRGHCPTGSKSNDLVLYVIMSCMIIPMFPFLNIFTVCMLLAAAAFNIVGLVFYKMKGREFMHAVWHLFSFGATVCDFFAVMYAAKLI